MPRTLTTAQMNRADVINDLIRHQRKLLGMSNLRAIDQLRPFLEYHIDHIDRGYTAPRHCLDHYTKTFEQYPWESVSECVDRMLADR